MILEDQSIGNDWHWHLGFQDQYAG